jgi:hypothetical protein
MRSLDSLDRRRFLFVSLLAFGIFALAASTLCSAQDDPFPNLPELAGIRPGMSAQKAYEIMKAEAGTAQIGIGEYPTVGVSDKPVPETFAVHIINKVPALTIQVWLTTPPSKQTVWAVGELLQYPDSDKLLVSTVFASWRQKFGQPAGSSVTGAYWALDEQGRHHPDLYNCRGGSNSNLTVTEPPGAVYEYTTAFYLANPTNSSCDSVMDVRATIPYMTLDDRYATTIQVIEIDHAALTRTQSLYHAYITQQNARAQQEQLEKAKQQKAPSY